MTVLVLVVLSGLGVAGYKFALSFISDKMMDEVANQALNQEEIEKLKNDPEVKKLLEQDLSTTETEDLPFHSKEEALKTVVQKFSINELNEMKNKAIHGTREDRAEIKAKLDERLSEEELRALKIIALKELSKNNGT